MNSCSLNSDYVANSCFYSLSVICFRKMKSSGNQVFQNILKLILAYILIVLVGTSACAVLYMIYTACSSIVAGEGLSALSFSLFLRGVILVGPVTLMLGGVFMCFYIIRHRLHKAVYISIYFVLGLVSWLVLVPVCMNLYASAQNSLQQPTEKRHLSPGYFRTDGTKILFYSAVRENNIADGLCIDTAARADNETNVYTFKNVKAADSYTGFADPLIQKNVRMPRAMELVTGTFGIFIAECHAAYEAGYLTWICYATMGLAMLAAVFLTDISKWRLVNVIIIAGNIITVFAVNITVAGGMLLQNADSFLKNSLGFMPKNSSPVQLIFNITYFILILIIGIISLTKRDISKTGE